LSDGSDSYFNNNPWRGNFPKTENWRQIAQSDLFTLGELVRQNNSDYEILLPDATFPGIDGSTVMLPLAVELARQHLGLTATQAQWFYNFSTTHYAYETLCRRIKNPYFLERYFPGTERVYSELPVELVLGTAPGEEELRIAKETGVDLVQKPVCRDAFVFITGKNNPVDNLTLDQVRDIFRGAIVNWSEVGGSNKTIKAYQREPGSGSQTGIEQLVMQGEPMADPRKVMVVVGMGELVDAVAEYENSAVSIGYSYRYYIDNQYQNKNIKQLKIDGVAPTDVNIISGAYPLSVNYYGVFRKGEEDGLGARFLDWILSNEGQLCVRQAGYIPMQK
jgi:phosphate transport system substrate-binding protein